MANIDSNYFKVEEDPIKQNKVEDILSEGENILVRLKPNRKVYILEAIFKSLPIALLWAGIDTAIILAMASSGAFSSMGFMSIFIIIFFALHLLPVWLYVFNVIKKVGEYKNVEYVFTDQRIIIRSGLIGVDFKVFYYTSISSVTVKVGLFDRMFHVGDLFLKTDNQTGVIEDIDHPYQYSSKIEKIILDIKTDIAYPNALRPEENAGYKTRYKG